MNIQPCRDTTDAVALYLPQRLFLKPFARINITLQLPTTKVSGKSISNWELMERFRTMIQPDTFSVLKVIKSSFEFLRFEGDIDIRSKLDKTLKNLDGRSIKLNGFPDSLKLKASEAKLDFPSRHAWDTFFRDAPNMDEMKPGERPDTIHLSNLPIKWFVSEKDKMDDDAKPSEYIFKKVFEKFGKIRYVDIPICDPFRKEMKSQITGMNNHLYDTDLYFEAYVQFSEYFGFVKAMDTLRGTKLMLKHRDGEAECIYIKVDFDRNKHLTDASIKRRSIVRERLLARQHTQEQKEQEEKEKLTKQEEKARHKLEKAEREKLEKMREREERRKAKQLEKLKAKESVEIFSKLAEEEKKLLKTQRKLQSIRLIEELFKRIQLKSSSISGNKYKTKGREDVPIRAGRDNIVQRYKVAQESELEYQREKLQKALEGKLVLRSALNIGKPKVRAGSISSLSSEHSDADNSYRRKKIKVEKPTSPDRNQMQYSPGQHVQPHMGPYGYPYPPYGNPGYSYPPPNAFGGFAPRGMFPPEGRGRGFVPRWRQPRPRMPYFYGQFPGNPNKQYYKLIKQLADAENLDNNGGDRSRSRSHSRRRSRSYSRSRSRSRYRSRHTRSRSRSRRRHSSYSSRSRSRSRSRRTRSRTRSKSRRSHSHKSRSRSRDRSKSRTKKLRSRSRSRSRTQRDRSRSRDSNRDRSVEGKSAVKNGETRDTNKERRSSVDSSKFISPSRMRRSRSKSWSLPKSKDKEKSWSKSPVDKE